MDAFPKRQVSSSLKKERKQTNKHSPSKGFCEGLYIFKVMLVKNLLLLRKAGENVIIGDILILLPSEKYEQ